MKKKAVLNSELSVSPHYTLINKQNNEKNRKTKEELKISKDFGWIIDNRILDCQLPFNFWVWLFFCDNFQN